MKTLFTKKLGISYPIMQGGLQAVALPKLAAAVSNAGGLGTINALNFPSPDALREGIAETRRLTKKPFAVNLTVLPALSPPPYEEYVKVLCENQVDAVETAGSNVNAFIKTLKGAGVTVIHKATQVRHALSAWKAGADFVTLDGYECAGHPGELDIGGMILFAEAAQVLKAKGVPYLCCGGFATGRQLAAALVFGAEGCVMGTRFLATDEAEIHQGIKDTLVESNTHQTVHIFRSLKHTGRVFKNELALKVLEIEARPGPTDFADLQPLVAGSRVRDAFASGDAEAGVWSAGPSMGLIHSVLSCDQLLSDMVKEARLACGEARSKL